MKRLLVGIILLIAIAVTTAASVDNLRFPVSFDFTKANERASPGDRIAQEQIKVYNDRVVIEVEGAQWATFTNTNSMDPVFDQGSNTLEIKPKHPRDIQVGDIISYYYEDSIIVHRVTKVEMDEKGVYYIVRGDNNKSEDPIKVRFEQVHGIVIGILY